MTQSITDIINRLADASRPGGDPALRRYTLHSHTEYCDGRAQMRAFARQAVDDGFIAYAFTPHSPITIESTCNMLADKVADFTAEYNRLASLYASAPITMLRGMEIDYLGDEWGPSHPYFKALNLDLAIGSVHFIPSQDGTMVDIDGHFDHFRDKMQRYFHNDINYVVDTYFAQSHRMIDAGGFDIIGHFDKIGHNASHFSDGIELTHRYQSMRADLLDHIAEAGLIVEINTKALADHRRFFPNRAIWADLFSSGVRVVVNSDAHVPALINAGRDEAFSIIDSLSI